MTSDDSKVKKSDKLCSFFGISKSKSVVAAKESTQSFNAQVSTQHPAMLSSVISQVNNKHMPSSSSAGQHRKDIFTKNVAKPAIKAQLPRPQERIETTDQLVYCNTLLLRDSCKRAVDGSASDSLEASLDKVELDWLARIERETMEQDRLRWLVTRMVEEFVKEPINDSTRVAEIVALGPILSRELYRKLLSTIIGEFDDSHLLDVDLLQGLVQLVQTAPSGFLVSDDLIKIFSILRVRLEGTHRQSSEHSYHLTLAISRILDVMAEHRVQDLGRVIEHEPLSAILSSLKGSSDPYLMYQACYAFQALQYVPDDETALQAVLRHSTGVVDGLVKITAAFKLDLVSVLEGLNNLQESLGGTFEVASTAYGGVCSLMESGHGVLDALKEGYGSGKKQPWYSALRVAYAFAQAGQLKDLNLLICEAPYCRDPLFQWGICQLLGDIAIDPIWDTTVRLQAVALLGGLYSDDADWGQDESVRTWMVTIFSQLAASPNQGVEASATVLLQKLKLDRGAISNLAYPLRSRLPIPTSSPLLAKVQNVPYIEYDIHILRLQRLKEGYVSVYIPPMAKANLQARDDDLFPLMDKVQRFLKSEGQVMLVLGDSGSGKSIFNTHLESELWRSYKRGGCIPLSINLAAIDRPDQDMIEKQLRLYNFSDGQIQEIREHRELALICDGYDESQQSVNLHRTNMLNQSGQWNTKMIIGCRTQYLGQDYRCRFIPQGAGHYDRQRLDLFQEAVIAPFSKEQIESYVQQYAPLESRTWRPQDYMDKLATIPNLMDLVKNPFLLTLALEALPAVIEDKPDLTTVKISRVQLYDVFVEHWLNVNKHRLENNTLTTDESDILDQLLEVGFVIMGVDYSMRLASAIYDKQGGNPVVKYVHLRDKNTWRAEFFGTEPEARLLRESSPLIRSGSLFRFVHKSVLEYFLSRAVFDPTSEDKDDTFCTPDKAASVSLPPFDVDGPLFKLNLLKEPSIIRFLSERAQQHHVFRDHLWAVVGLSKTDATAATAAANAITILVQAGVHFNCADLRGIRIPGADLSDGQFDSVKFQGADLAGVNFSRTWLRNVDVTNAQMDGARFGELPYLEEKSGVFACAYSPGGRMFAVALGDKTVGIYNTSTWSKIRELEGHRKAVYSVAFAPDSRQIISGGGDMTVRVWDSGSGESLLVAEGHTAEVKAVTFLPGGKQIASSGDDQTVRVWDSRTGESLFVLKAHSGAVVTLAHSPDGKQLVSGSADETIRLWNTTTGEPGAVWKSLHGPVRSLAYSPDGQRVVSGHEEGEVQVLSAVSGDVLLTLEGHSWAVTGVALSSNGQYIATSSEDKTVRLWDASTGAIISTLTGHLFDIYDVAFSPDGHQIASGSEDNLVRLWEVDPSASNVAPPSFGSVCRITYSPDGRSILSGNSSGAVQEWDPVLGEAKPILQKCLGGFPSMAFSPDGSQFASGGRDGYIRLWDRHTGASASDVLRADDDAFRGRDKSILDMTYSPCGRWIISIALNKAVRLWDVQQGKQEQVIETPAADMDDNVRCVAFSPTGLQFAMGYLDGTVCLFDLGKRSCVKFTRTGEDPVRVLTYAPDGQELAVGTSTAICFWDFHSEEEEEQEERPCVELIKDGLPAHCLVYSPCGQWVVSSTGNVRLWYHGKESWTCIAVVRGFFYSVASVAWNPVSPLEFVTGCLGDGSVSVWRILNNGSDDGGPNKEVESVSVSIKMVWGSGVGRLCTSGLTLEGAIGLAPIYRKLLAQRGSR